MSGMFQRTVSVTVAGHAMKTLSPEDSLLVLSAHAAKHVWGRLVWLCDIAQLMKLPSLDWNAIWAEARKLGMLRILGGTLLAANHLLQAPLPVSAKEPLEEVGASALATDI